MKRGKRYPPPEPLMRFLPFVILVILCAALSIILLQPEQKSASPLIGKTLPAYDLPMLGKSPSFAANTPMLINFFATWCAPCKAEHALLLKLKKEHNVPILGIAWHDKPAAVEAMLKKDGNPFASVSIDETGKTTTTFGLTGVPETIVVNAEGIVIAIFKEPLHESLIEQKLLPLLKGADHAP